ncbi:protein of unknown function [Flaviramulus basaltis]|uniref:3-keto-alpha-glucoside-1,2-lyase/3-keto-2-hydroxy-glucal hydratase domain-containing protein n=1 Tax=Flaviramulus basaltis TaxID=369401 RepID=A0A1K2IQ93_9FLAO|nr:DUF1080 domain-containing protein [Flaviramulus basaltis]SFZ94368.1 protein of unknown function [Flaviramulus basaltis]
MKNSIKLLVIILFSFVLNCKNNKNQKEEIAQEDKWISLFNGKDLTGWDTNLGMHYEEGQDIWNQKALTNYKPFGINNDSLKVFSVVEVDGEAALRLSGEVYGGISTVDEFENYHLQVEFKWGTLKFAPRLDVVRDSGILYHGNGEQGTEAGFWLRSQEMQVQEGDCGDYWGIAGAQVNVRTEMRADSLYQYNPKGELRHFGDGSELGRNVKKFPDAEKPTGEWNTLDLYTFGDKSAHVVNGAVTMILENSRITIDSITKPLTKGKIQLQVEGAEIYYRHIKIKTLDEFPEF